MLGFDRTDDLMAKPEVIVIGGTREDYAAGLRAVVEREQQQKAQAVGPDYYPAGDRCGDRGSPVPSRSTAAMHDADAGTRADQRPGLVADGKLVQRS